MLIYYETFNLHTTTYPLLRVKNKTMRDPKKDHEALRKRNLWTWLFIIVVFGGFLLLMFVFPEVIQNVHNFINK